MAGHEGGSTGELERESPKNLRDAMSPVLFVLPPLFSAGHFFLLLRLLASEASPFASLAVSWIGALGGLLAAVIALFCWSSPGFVRRPWGVRSAAISAFSGWAIVTGVVFTISPVWSPLAMTLMCLPGAFAGVIVAWVVARRGRVAPVAATVGSPVWVPRARLVFVLVGVGVAAVAAIGAWGLRVESQLRPDGVMLGSHLLVRLSLFVAVMAAVVAFECIQIGRTPERVVPWSGFRAASVVGWSLVHAPWIAHAARLDAVSAGVDQLTNAVLAAADTAGWIARGGWALLAVALIGLLARVRVPATPRIRLMFGSDSAVVRSVVRDVERELMDDYVGLWVIPWRLRRLLPRADGDTVRNLSEKVLHELLSGGACLGELDGNTGEFSSRNSADPVAEVMEGWRLLGRDPNIGELAWLVGASQREEISDAPT